MYFIEPSLRGLLGVFFRHQAKFFLTFFLIVAAGAFYISKIDRVYEARGSFLIKLGQGAVPSVSRLGGQGGGSLLPSERSDVIHSNIRIFKSEELLTTAVREFGAERLYPGIGLTLSGGDTAESAAVERLARDIQATTDSQSSIVEVGVRNADPAVAAEFAKRLISLFIARQSSVYGAPQAGFLKGEAEGAQKRLKESQGKLLAFKQEVGIFDLDGETAKLLDEKSNLSTLAYQAVTAAQANLTRLEAEAAEARSTYRADSPYVRRINDSLAVAKREVEKRQGDLNNAGNSALSPKLSAIDKRLAYLEQHRGPYTDLEQRVREDEENLKFYQQRGEEARASDLLRQQGLTRISVVDNPAVPARPLPRRRPLLVLAVLMTAGLFGLGVVVASELASDTLAVPEQVLPAVGLPVLACFEEGKAA